MSTAGLEKPVDRRANYLGYRGTPDGLRWARTAVAWGPTAEVLTRSLLTIGLDELTGGKPSFVNFPREALFHEMAGQLPPQLVIEVLEDVGADEDVIAACADLRRRGFRIALDDYCFEPEREPLLADLAISLHCVISQRLVHARDTVSGQAINLGTGSGTTLLEAATLVAHAAGIADARAAGDHAAAIDQGQRAPGAQAEQVRRLDARSAGLARSVGLV